MASILANTLALAVMGVGLIYVRSKLSKKSVRSPPGPPSDPFIGHLRLIPHQAQDVFFYELGKTYGECWPTNDYQAPAEVVDAYFLGDVVQLKVLGRSMIILNSVEAAVDLLDKRSSIYSDRPDFPIYDILGVSDSLTFAKYGKDFRTQRRMIQQYFSNSKCPEHRPIQVREARVLAMNMSFSSEECYNHLLRFSTAIIMETGYGHQIKSDEDLYLKIAEECCQIAADSGPPGGTPVDLFPILRYFPSWFPGTHYANYARKSASAFERLREYPFGQVMEAMRKGTARPSFLLTQLEALRDKGDDDETNVKLIQAASMIIYISGAETTSSSLDFFVLAMLLHPEYQARAQKEIESVIGSDRLPEFYDRERLPFVECLVQEMLRWNQAIPTIVPHRLMEDDIYRDMFLPKGSIIIPNVRGMTWDEKIYKNPFQFDPTRYFPAPAGREEPFSTAHFGFGRRICPCRFLADDSLWIAIVTLLATGTFLKSLDTEGKEIILDATPVMIGITCHPRPFQCRFVPRSKTTMELLKQSTES